MCSEACCTLCPRFLEDGLAGAGSGGAGAGGWTEVGGRGVEEEGGDVGSEGVEGGGTRPFYHPPPGREGGGGT